LRLATSHRSKIEGLYRDIRFPEAIDWWSAHYAQDERDVAISNARHLDPTRQAIENDVWQRITPANGRVLDLACGRGFFSRRLREAVARPVRVVGIDLAETILRVAQSEQGWMQVVLCTAERLPFQEDTFDVILLISAIEQMEHPESLVPELERVLRPRGHLYLCLHKPYLDPFILPVLARWSLSLAEAGYRRIRPRLPEPAQPADERVGYSGTLGDLRRNLRIWLRDAGFEWVESMALLHQFEWRLYKRFVPWAIPFLLQLGQHLNRLPLSYYKNLEYWLLRKP
jgi:SAM-dependent methyltransferase